MSTFTFVDDTDMVENSVHKESWKALLERIQLSLDMWECLIRTPGGALEPPKSDWAKTYLPPMEKWKIILGTILNTRQGFHA
jgi:hypothetical protein